MNMKRTLACALLLGLAWSGAALELQAQKKPKIKPTVSFAPSWDAALAEAQLLNVPIVVHSHGFY